ncbi:MAG: hypothetical protein J5671_08465 [Bacteroidaceae bacterium]|nr:hypothetical protein [Bacteroidaceae bacterium]
MILPEDFIALMREHLGDGQAEALFNGLQQPSTVSVRFNPLKTANLTLNREALGDPVPWCPDAYYLDGRKAFTFDPLFHAGAYYVQDASSMYLAEILRKYLHGVDGTDESNGQKESLVALDACAAPGGKSTLLAAYLPKGSMLISNEPIHKRAQVLAENMQKWGSPNSYVTNNFPQDFGHLRSTFDFILTDVPCSGEGMFRKDETAIREWSLENVRKCAERQRDILQAIMPTLKPDGLLVYSTCTFNRIEDEEQVQWLVSEYGLQLLEERHFFPGRDRGEGLYMAALRKPEFDAAVPSRSLNSLKSLRTIEPQLIIDPEAPVVELNYVQAIAYLRREALHLEAPRGMVTVTYCGVPLGPAKSVGTRLNNLYPQEWRIRTTFNPIEPRPNFFM